MTDINQAKEKDNFRTTVLIKLENLAEKMDETKKDLTDDIKTLFGLIKERDQQCRGHARKTKR